MGFLRNFYHLFFAWLGNIIYGFPSRKLYVIGVTGTKGKSTTVELINAILEEAGEKTAIISSLRFKIGNENRKNDTANSMPGRFFIQHFLRRAVRAGCKYAIIEVTSQGIIQHRHEFIHWDAALYTNLRPEHIEAHGSFEKYREAKTKFFWYAAHKSKKPARHLFVNDDDPSKEYFIAAGNGSAEIHRFSREEFIRQKLETGSTGSPRDGKNAIGDWLLSNFNLENAAAATAVAEVCGVSWVVVKKAFQKFKGIPGRLETIQAQPFRVVIDYAHTPDSLEKVYETLTNTSQKLKNSAFGGKNQRLVCVLGAAGGGRDKWKRPVMGKIAAEYCREIILTDEDSYDEKTEEILNQIEAGIRDNQRASQRPLATVHRITDRTEAIKKAISLAKKGDTVIITGKGSESWIHLANGKKLPWNEKEVVLQLLSEL